MAETVKKSRIVSEDDLEEFFMQEFNTRLKHCLSQEKVQPNSPTATATDQSEEGIYEEIGNRPEQQQNREEEVLYDTPKPTPIIADSEDEKKRNGIDTNGGGLYENVVEDSNPILIVQEPRDESESSKIVETARDRMLLSTDDISCLLFTQTVTSPMLTPSEENIDFLKAFETENSNTSEGGNKIEDTSEKNKNFITEQSEPIYENFPDVKAQCRTFIDKEISEAKKNSSEEDIPSRPFLIPDVCREATLKEKTDEDEDAEDVESGASESTETETIGSDDQQKPVESNQEIIDVPTDEDDVIEVPIEGLNSSCLDADSPSRMVDAIKVEIMRKSVGGNEAVKSGAGGDKHELLELRTIDIAKHINKFESKAASRDEEDFESNEDVDEESMETTTETSYMETTTTSSSTVETSGTASGTVQDKSSLKKKKSKKSRSHDKENISVTDLDCTNSSRFGEYKYNVNVKHLQSTSVDSVYQSSRADGIFKGVSVSALRQKFLEPITNNLTPVEKETPTTSNRLSSSKSSFNKFDALQKKNVLHVRSSDSSKAQEKFNGAPTADMSNCKSCGKVVFQMEQIKAERSVWHKTCFRCQECNKQLTVDTYQSNEGTVYCKPHFKSLFAPKAVEDEQQSVPKKHELIIRENQPLELPPDVVRASDKPDLGLEELQSLNVRERFQVFENFQEQNQELSNSVSSGGTVNVKRSPSILSKLAKFQAKGMDVGVPVDALNGIPIDESSSEDEGQHRGGRRASDASDASGAEDGEDADLVRARRVQKEKPFHFAGMSDVKSRWERGERGGQSRDERREERKHEIQTIRSRLFLGKQGKMKEAYQQAVLESESGANLRRPATPPPVVEVATKSLKEKFEKGEVYGGGAEEGRKEMEEDMSVFESGIGRKSRSIFLELDANASKAPQMSPVSPSKQQAADVKKAREAYMARQASSHEDAVKSSEQPDDVRIETSDIQRRFKFFETYREPEKERKPFRITPPRDGQQKAESPEREVYRDPDIVRAEEQTEDSVIAKETHTATKVLSKFRQMEENMNREPLNLGPKPLKRFTPPPEPAPRTGGASDGEASDASDGDDDDGEESESLEEVDHRSPDADLVEAQKAARARQLRAKFEKWEAKEIEREQQQQQQQMVNVVAEECADGEQQAQIESTKTLRAKFESLKDSQNDANNRQPKVKVNRFVDTTSTLELCDGCKEKIYPLEKVSVHNMNYHKKCFKCTECGTVLRMDSYTYNQGKIYCIPHFKRLFISKGNYDTGFGVEQRKDKWNAASA